MKESVFIGKEYKTFISSTEHFSWRISIIYLYSPQKPFVNSNMKVKKFIAVKHTHFIQQLARTRQTLFFY